MSRYGSIQGFLRYSRAYQDNITTAEASNWLIDASTEIDGIISQRYVTPVTGTPPLLALLCNRLAAYRAIDSLLSDVQPNASEANTRKLNETLEFLQKIAIGEVELRSSAGTIVSVKGGGGRLSYAAALTRTLGNTSTTENTPIDDWAVE